MTATLPEEQVTAGRDAVEARATGRARLWRGVGLLLTGLVTLFAWGVGARNGDTAFAISQFGDKVQVPVVRFPGGGAAMVMGGVIVLIAVGELALGYTRRQLRWAIGVSLLLFVVAFLCWAGTGNPGNPLSLTGLVQQTVVSALPFILGALAGIVCERSGVINIAIEGQMLVGAFAGAMFASSAGSLGVGLLAALLGGALIGLLLAVFAIRYLVNQVVLGVVLNTFALGLTNLGYHSIMQSDPNSFNAGLVLSPIKIPLLGDIPVLGQALFDVNVIVYLTYGLIVAVDVGLFRTRWGLRTRAVGEHPRAADTVGIKVQRTRYRNVLIGGLIAGLAGATLTIGGSGRSTATSPPARASSPSPPSSSAGGAPAARSPPRCCSASPTSCRCCCRRSTRRWRYRRPS